jgi:hypothetical protein
MSVIAKVWRINSDVREKKVEGREETYQKVTPLGFWLRIHQHLEPQGEHLQNGGLTCYNE